MFTLNTYEENTNHQICGLNVQAKNSVFTQLRLINTTFLFQGGVLLGNLGDLDYTSANA